MTAQAVIQLVIQIIALSAQVEPYIVQAIKDLQAMIANGDQPTQAQLDDLVARATAQSAAIQAL